AAVDLADADQLDHWRGRRRVGVGDDGRGGDRHPRWPSVVELRAPPPVRLAKPAGTSTTTLSVACSPLVISISAPLRPPVVTVRVWVGPSAVPVVATVTVDWPFVVVTAGAGTRRALALWAVVMDAVALEPTKNLVGSPV